MDTETGREVLLAGDPAPIGPALASVLSELLKRGFHVWDVHVSTAGRYEVLLDREIDSQLAEELSLPRGVETFEDHDEQDRRRGLGFLCQETGPAMRRGTASTPSQPTRGGRGSIGQPLAAERRDVGLRR